jgi:hypothetical protein
VSAGLKAAARLLNHSRFEVIPTDSIEEAVLSWVPREVTLTVTASPTKGLEATISLAERLRQHGYSVVPHVSARLVVDNGHLAEIVARLTACGIDDIFVPAGDADPPAGRFDSALSLLVQLESLGRPFARTGITGYRRAIPTSTTTSRSNRCGTSVSTRRTSQQPLLRSLGGQALAATDTGSGGHFAALLRTSRPRRADQVAQHGDQDWGGRVGPLRVGPRGVVFADGSARRLQPEPSIGAHRRRPRRSGFERRGSAPLHF